MEERLWNIFLGYPQVVTFC